MHKFELTISVKDSARTFPHTVMADDIHSAYSQAIQEFETANPGKGCNIVHIRMVDLPVEAAITVTD